MMRSDSIKRINIVSVGMAFLMLLLIVKLFFVGVIHGRDYTARADRQYLLPSGSVYDRGTIFLSTKDGQLVSGATLSGGFKIAITPKLVIDPERTFTNISPFLPELDYDSFIAKAAKVTDPYEEIAVRVPKEAADAISALHDKGISIYQEKWRFYPGGDLAARTIGFVAYKGDSLGGRYGLERQYDDVLNRTGGDVDLNFFAEVFSELGATLFHHSAREGDIVTTIEPTVQEYLEKTLGGIQTTYTSDETGGIVIDPHTGEIIAMAALPDFNLNEFQKVSDPLIYANPLVEKDFEIGSVVKTLTMAAGIDAGVVTPETTYNDKGSLTLDGSTIYNFDKKARGVIPMQEILNQSLNVGASFVMQKLGKDKFRDYFMSYGFGSLSGVDMPGEIHSIINNLQSPRDIEYATASFGQGIAVTPVAAVRAFSVIANGGNLITPHLVKEIRYKNGTVEPVIYPITTGVLKKQTTDTLAGMMTKVVDTALLGGTEKTEHYRVAAKTGTAQIARPNGGGYYEDRYLHTMYGFYPAYNPKFLVFLYTSNPHGVPYAANTLGRPFIDTARFLLSYYNVAPDR